MTCHALYGEIFKASSVSLSFRSKSSLNRKSCAERTSHIHGDAQPSGLWQRLYMFPKMSMFPSNIGIVRWGDVRELKWSSVARIETRLLTLYLLPSFLVERRCCGFRYAWVRNVPLSLIGFTSNSDTSLNFSVPIWKVGSIIVKF